MIHYINRIKDKSYDHLNGSDPREQRVEEMDSLILCLNQYKPDMHVCGTDPKRIKGFEAWPSSRWIPKWHMCREDPNNIAKVLKTELTLDSQPTECGPDCPLQTQWSWLHAKKIKIINILQRISTGLRIVQYNIQNIQATNPNCSTW